MKTCRVCQRPFQPDRQRLRCCGPTCSNLFDRAMQNEEHAQRLYQQINAADHAWQRFAFGRIIFQ